MKRLIVTIFALLTLVGPLAQADDLGAYALFGRTSNDLRVKKYMTILTGENTATWSYNTITYKINDDGSRSYLYNQERYDSIYVQNVSDFCTSNKGTLEQVQVSGKTYNSCKIVTPAGQASTVTTWYAEGVPFGIVKKLEQYNINSSNYLYYDDELLEQGHTNG